MPKVTQWVFGGQGGSVCMPRTHGSIYPKPTPTVHWLTSPAGSACAQLYKSKDPMSPLSLDPCPFTSFSANVIFLSHKQIYETNSICFSSFSYESVHSHWFLGVLIRNTSTMCCHPSSSSHCPQSPGKPPRVRVAQQLLPTPFPWTPPSRRCTFHSTIFLCEPLTSPSFQIKSKLYKLKQNMTTKSDFGVLR